MLSAAARHSRISSSSFGPIGIYQIHLPTRQTCHILLPRYQLCRILLLTTTLKLARQTSQLLILNRKVGLFLDIRRLERVAQSKHQKPFSRCADLRGSQAMSASSATDSDDIRSRGQQPMLASQRAKQSQRPTESNRTGKIDRGFFPLGYKEAVSQWVRLSTTASKCVTDEISGRMCRPLLRSIKSCLSYPI